MIDYRLQKIYNINQLSSATGRLFSVFLLVMGFLCFFCNSFSAKAAFKYKEVEAQITFDCKDIYGTEDESYKICIKTNMANAPVPVEDTVIVNEAGKGSFHIRITAYLLFLFLLICLLSNTVLSTV